MANTPEDTKQSTSTPDEPAGELKRDRQRDDGGPTYGGEGWDAADQRGDQRYGKARNDDADPSTLVKAGEDADNVADTEIESGGEQEGMGHRQAPRSAR